MIPANFHMFHFKFVGTRALVWIHPHLMTVPPACRKTMPLPCRVFMKSPEFPICQDESDLIRPKTLPSCLLLCGWAETAVFLTKSTRDRNHLNRSCGIHLAAKQPCPPQKHVPMERTRLISTDQSEPKAAKKAPRLKTIPSYLSIGTSKRIHLYVYIYNKYCSLWFGQIYRYNNNCRVFILTSSLPTFAISLYQLMILSTLAMPLHNMLCLQPGFRIHVKKGAKLQLGWQHPESLSHVPPLQNRSHLWTL